VFDAISARIAEDLGFEPACWSKQFLNAGLSGG
jgi:hypothetical protein